MRLICPIRPISRISHFRFVTAKCEGCVPLHRSLRRRSVFAFFTEFGCHCLTDFGQAVLFACCENSEDTASPKTPMQWHITLTSSSDNARGIDLFHRRILAKTHAAEEADRQEPLREFIMSRGSLASILLHQVSRRHKIRAQDRNSGTEFNC